MSGARLLLEAVDVGDPLRWRWLLRDEVTGAPIADHRVELDPGRAQLIGDLYGHALADKGQIADAGEWAGRELLGPAGAAIAAAAKSGSVTVRVVAPAPADAVLTWPLELVHVDGQPLAALRDVTFVYDVTGNAARHAAGYTAKDPATDVLRVLAVFSLPTRTSALALRRERHALTRMLRRIAARQRAAVELHVVQYGVTRGRLAEIAEDGDGWDVLHVAGHGARGLFLLEHADGSPDPVDPAALTELLRPARRRVKLAVLSACQSAAETTAETLRLTGLTEAAIQEAAIQEAAIQETATQETATQEVPGLARALVTELDCAVVAMRYPVTDRFAIAFGDSLYDQLLSRGQPLDIAVARATASQATATPGQAASGQATLSLVTPAVFGARAAGLVLKPPRGQPRQDPAEQKMGFFPAEPERFAGRAQTMARASAALAPDSGRTAVLLHGMTGSGKTVCALELAYRHQDIFGVVAYWQVPTRGDEWTSALPGLATALEVQLGGYGFTMTGHIGTTAALGNYLPRLRRVLENFGLLLVLDNLETLLTPDGTWRDPRWGMLIQAFTRHGGQSRVIMTSRIQPAGLGPATLMLPVHALSLRESAALAGELPRLGALLRAGTTQDADRVRRVLRIAQGHPKLLELADAAAAHRDRLDTQLAAAEQMTAEQVTDGQRLEQFFRDGQSTLDTGQFVAALTAWTRTALSALEPPARLLAGFVACLEDADREAAIIEATWAGLWERMEQPGHPPAIGPLLAELADAALIQPDGAQDVLTYSMHPGVAAVIGAAGPDIRDAVDSELATFWYTLTHQVRQRPDGRDSRLVVRAGLSAAPYSLRRQDWGTASVVLEQVIVRDGSPGTIQAALPGLRRIAAATGAPRDQAILARALAAVEPGEAGRLMREALDAVVASGDWRLASAIAGALARLLRESGRLGEALETVTHMADYTDLAGLGPWNQMLDQGQRLQILGLMGEHERVLTEVDELRDQMTRLPPRRSVYESAPSWNVRELILDAGRSAAEALGEWQRGLDLNDELLASKRQRGAGEQELALGRLPAGGLLIRLGRLAEAGELLRGCEQVFNHHNDVMHLAMVCSLRADLEDESGRRDVAAGLERSALRLRYGLPEPGPIAVSHYNLGAYLRGSDPVEQRAHRLAAALIFRLAGLSLELASAQHTVAAEASDAPPVSLAEVIEVAERTEGVRLAELLTTLEPGTKLAEDALARIQRYGG